MTASRSLRSLAVKSTSAANVSFRSSHGSTLTDQRLVVSEFAQPRAELRGQPRAGEPKLALDRGKRDADRFGGFLQRQATEKALFEDLALARIDLLEACQGFVEIGDRVDLRIRDLECVLQFDGPVPSAAALRSPRPRVVDQQLAHQPRGHGEKVRAVAKARAVQIDQLEVRLVDQRRRIER